MLCYLHPELLTSLGTLWLVGIVSSHVCIIDLQCFLDSLGVQVEDAVKNDLAFLYHIDSLNIEKLLCLTRLLLFSLQLLDLSLADIDGVIDLKEIGETLLLVGLFLLQMPNKILQVVTLHKHIECHVVNSFGCRSLELDAVLSEVVAGISIGTLWDLMHSWN